MKTVLTVGKNNSCHFDTISGALKYSENIDPTINVSILIQEGVYQERIFINRSNISLFGLGSVVVVGNAYALQKDEHGQTINTFKTATCYINGDFVTLNNLTIQNNAGQGHVVGQAVALHINGKYAKVLYCNLKAYQDTLFIGPLPLSNSDGTPIKTFATSERKHVQAYFKHCYIEGTIDFIFGGGTAYFDQCQIHSLDQERVCEVDGYITAASTEKEIRYGLVMNECIVTADNNLNVYLGRPWRMFAHTVFQKCYLGEHILPSGWEEWSNVNKHETTRYGEFENIHTSDIKRVGWSKTLLKPILMEDMFDNQMIKFIKES